MWTISHIQSHQVCVQVHLSFKRTTTFATFHKVPVEENRMCQSDVLGSISKSKIRFGLSSASRKRFSSWGLWPGHTLALFDMFASHDPQVATRLDFTRMFDLLMLLISPSSWYRFTTVSFVSKEIALVGRHVEIFVKTQICHKPYFYFQEVCRTSSFFYYEKCMRFFVKKSHHFLSPLQRKFT